MNTLSTVKSVSVISQNDESDNDLFLAVIKLI